MKGNPERAPSRWANILQKQTPLCTARQKHLAYQKALYIKTSVKTFVRTTVKWHEDTDIILFVFAHWLAKKPHMR